ncbi:MAG: hypothetical protein JWN01_445 [Patescibacteria group bacterium]|nr:hypothetical protein [Patescibacteria group bacterium]
MKRLIAALSGITLILAIIAQPLAEVARAAGANLITNPSVETAAGALPSGWSQGGWGTNTAAFSYDSTGAQNGARSLGLTVSGYSSGDAKWYFSPVAVAASTKYTFSDWYQSGVATELDAQVQDAAGNYSYVWLADVPASASWKQLSVDFTTPAGAKNVTVFHVIAGNGTLKTDNYSLAETAATPSPTPSPSPSPTVTPSPSPTVTPSPSASPSPSPTPNPSASPTPSPTPSPSPTPTPAAGIPNPGLETANGATPQGWASDYWGTNTPAFTYENTGHASSRSVKVNVTSYTSGSANWNYAPQPVKVGGHYRFTDWYQSNTDTEIDVGVTMSNGTVQYFYLGKVLPSTTWAQASAEFDMPAGAVSATVFHLIAAKGYLTTDDYSFGIYQPSPFSRGLVTLTFDDGWTNQYTNALPLLKKYNEPATFYIISGELTDQPDYMSVTQIKALQAQGSEIASHSVTHPDLTTLTAAKLTAEMKNSQTTLKANFGGTISNFAYPFGAYNAKTITEGLKYYQTQRSTDSGYNTKDNLSLTTLKVQNIYASTTPAQVQAWVNQAARDKTWLILVYHEVGATPIDPTDTDYLTKPADLDAELQIIKNSGLGVLTIAQAIKEVLPQVGK